MVGKRAFVLFVFKFEERGRNSVATGNMGDGAVWWIECMGAAWGSVWELQHRARWEDRARSQHAATVHLTLHPQNDKICEPVLKVRNFSNLSIKMYYITMSGLYVSLKVGAGQQGAKSP